MDAALPHDAPPCAQDESVSPRTAPGLVLAALPVAAWRTAPSGACTQVNAQWSALTGLREEEALGDGWLAAVHPDDRVRVDAAWRAALAGGPAFAVDVRYLRRDGSVRHVVSTAAPEPHGDGMLGVVVDVTDSRLAEVRRAARDDVSDEGLLVLAHDGAVLEANRRALALLDLSAEEVAGRAPVPEAGRSSRPAARPPSPRRQPRWSATPRRRAARSRCACRMARAAGCGSRSGHVAVEADGSQGVVAVLRDETAERRERRIAQALHEVAAVVAADPTVEALCAVLAGAASSVLELDRSAVCHVEGDGTVRVLAHVPLGEGHPRPGDVMPRGSGTAVERAVAAGGPVRLLAPPPLTGRAERVGEAVAYPIVVEGRVWGTISAGAHAGSRVSPDAEVHLARLAELAAVAISSADTHERLRALAVTDPLTGLPNRRRFEERLVAEVARARRIGAPLALVVLDLDAFKAVNDTLGHPVGDSVLRAVADALRAVSRVGETVCRIGGEEFAWLLPSADAGRALGAAERARARIEADTALRSVRVTASAGICDLETAGSGGDLVRLADAALYAAKRGGRDRSVVQRAPAQRASAWASRRCSPTSPGTSPRCCCGTR